MSSEEKELPDTYEVLVGIWKIEEIRDNCIYKTKYIQDKWILPSERNNPEKGYCYGAPKDQNIVPIRYKGEKK